VDLRKKEREKDEVEMRSNQIMKKRNTCLEGHHNKSENKEMNREHVFFERKKQCQSSVILLLPFEEGTKEERET
jgi:hypothetical protein